MLDFIIKYGESVKYEKRAAKSNYYYRTASLSDKAITIFEDNMDEFFDIIKDKAFEFLILLCLDICILTINLRKNCKIQS